MSVVGIQKDMAFIGDVMAISILLFVRCGEVRCEGSCDVIIVWVLAGGDQEITGDVQVSRRVRVVQPHHVLAAASSIQRDR
jgi:hypothetical protein